MWHALLTYVIGAFHHRVQIVLARFLAWTKPAAGGQVLGTLTDLARSKRELVAENALLRQQLIVLSRSVKHPKMTRTGRVLLVLLASRVRAWRKALLIIKPDTLLRWHREGFRLFWRHKSKTTTRSPRWPRSPSSRTSDPGTSISVQDAPQVGARIGSPLRRMDFSASSRLLGRHNCLKTAGSTDRP